MIKQHLKKILTIAMTFAVIFSVQSCSKLLQSLVFNNLTLQPGTITITIPPTADTASTVTLGSATNNYNIDSFIKASTSNQLGVSNITSVKLTSCVISITNGASAANNVANFQSFNASFYSSSNTTPFTLSVSNPDTYATSITMPVDTTQQLVGYLSNSSTTFNYSASGKLRRPITDTLTCTINYTFSVSAKG